MGYTWQASPAPINDFVTIARRITQHHPSKSLILLALDKHRDPRATGIRTRNDYYRAAVSRITAVEIRNGTELDRRVVYQNPTT